MTDAFDEELWANKLESGLEAINFLEIKDPTKIIDDAVDTLYEGLAENEAPCRAAIEKIANEEHRKLAFDRLKYHLMQRFAAILPNDFMNPPDTSNFASLIADFDAKTFQLWANVGKSLSRLEEAIAGLRDDVAAQILARVEAPGFAEDYQAWLDAETEELFAQPDEEEKKPDINKKIDHAVNNGVAGFVVFLLIAGALAAPLLSMCMAE